MNESINELTKSMDQEMRSNESMNDRPGQVQPRV